MEEPQASLAKYTSPAEADLFVWADTVIHSERVSEFLNYGLNFYAG